MPPECFQCHFSECGFRSQHSCSFEPNRSLESYTMSLKRPAYPSASKHTLSLFLIQAHLKLLKPPATFFSRQGNSRRVLTVGLVAMQLSGQIQDPSCGSGLGMQSGTEGRNCAEGRSGLMVRDLELPGRVFSCSYSGIDSRATRN